MELSIKDFRCFHRAEGIPFRPINLLVGENSSGKSSLLAAIRFVYDLFSRDEKASFNKDPFFLGSYEQIAHFRGGRFGRAPKFSFSLTGEIDLTRPTMLRAKSRLGSRGPLPSNFELTVELVNDRSQPTASRAVFDCARFGFTATFGEKVRLVIRTPSIADYEFTDRLGPRDAESLVTSFSYLDFVLRDFRFLTSGEKGQVAEEHLEEIVVLYELYRQAKRSLPNDVYASAPVRSKPARTYNPGETELTASGEHTPYILAQIKAFDEGLWSEIEKTIGVFGKKAGLFDSVNIKRFSKTKGGPFQLEVTLGAAKSNIIDVGYGVSQALPIITDLVRAKRRTLFLFQQPEVHLHPRAQAELATFFLQMVHAKKHVLFLETHSDYLIDRIRSEARDGRYIRPEDVSILFFEKKDLDVIIHPISIDSQGNVRGAPAHYREFFIREEFRSAGVEL